MSHFDFTRCALVLLLAALGGCGKDSPAAPSTPAAPAASCPAGTVVEGTPALTARLVVSGLQSPLDLQVAAGDRARLFVVEQAGRIRIIRGGSIVSPAFLDIVARVGSGGERGLLGLAFHPQYAANGRFFVNYTDRSGDTHISEFRSAPSSDAADPASERELMFVAQPFSNHNGGGLAFSADGTLYIGLGDGGSGGDPMRNGQSLGTRLGKLLRINVDAGSPFGVPSDNPFLGRPGALSEIYAFGLRNPWRFSFDRGTGDLYIGDVGQNAVEEVDVETSPRRGGQNYGWNIMEGSRCFQPSSGCNMSGLTMPVLDYPRPQGASVTGGVVYRGCRMPGYAGTYFYGDYVSGFVRSFRLSGGAATDQRDWTASFRGVRNPSSFGVDADGEVYVVEYGGSVYRIEPAT